MKRILAAFAVAALLGGLAGAADPLQSVTIEFGIVSTGFGGGSGDFVTQGALDEEGTAYLGQWSVGWWGWSSVWDLTLCGLGGTISITLENGSWEICAGTGDYAALEGSGTYTVSYQLLSATGGWWGLPLYLETYVLEGVVQ